MISTAQEMIEESVSYEFGNGDTRVSTRSHKRLFDAASNSQTMVRQRDLVQPPASTATLVNVLDQSG